VFITIKCEANIENVRGGAVCNTIVQGYDDPRPAFIEFICGVSRSTEVEVFVPAITIPS